MRNQRTTHRRTFSVSVARSTWLISRAGRNADGPSTVGKKMRSVAHAWRCTWRLRADPKRCRKETAPSRGRATLGRSPDPASAISKICGSITLYFGVRFSKTTMSRRPQSAFPSIIQRSVFRNSQRPTVGSLAPAALPRSSAARAGIPSIVNLATISGRFCPSTCRDSITTSPTRACSTGAARPTSDRRTSRSWVRARPHGSAHATMEQHVPCHCSRKHRSGKIAPALERFDPVEARGGAIRPTAHGGLERFARPAPRSRGSPPRLARLHRAATHYRLQRLPGRYTDAPRPKCLSQALPAHSRRQILGGYGRDGLLSRVSGPATRTAPAKSVHDKQTQGNGASCKSGRLRNQRRDFRGAERGIKNLHVL